MSSFTKKFAATTRAGTIRAALLTALLAVLASSVVLAPDAVAALCDRHKTTLFGVKEDNSPGPCPECAKEGTQTAPLPPLPEPEQPSAPAPAPAPTPIPAPVPAAPPKVIINHILANSSWQIGRTGAYAMTFFHNGNFTRIHEGRILEGKWRVVAPRIVAAKIGTAPETTFYLAADNKTLMQLVPGRANIQWTFSGRPEAAAPVRTATPTKQPTPQQAAAPTTSDLRHGPRTVALPGGVKLEMAWIRPGTFMMGSPTSEKERETWGRDETLHQVTISKGFWLGKYPVTQAQWKAVMGTDVHGQYLCGHDWGDINGVGDDHPIYFVSWHEAQEFCARLTEIEQRAGRLPRGYRFALPTEAQWEYACRAGDRTNKVFHFGNSLTSRQANFNGNEPYGTKTRGPHLNRTTRVGSYSANGWGLYDMHGNVWEWCEDTLADYPRGPVTDPCNTSGGWRVHRGGGWLNPAHHCRAAARGAQPTGHRHAYLGFRVALAPERK
ncbi:MAG: formylglycine-generating enzyme family protein [Puniceicoccales bacterium]|jgi:formylglycine-generating enzyme required for sulfatase activity|nr:formylglycine-generating enzyme family protein [Puniceicoccales bacterium]